MRYLLSNLDSGHNKIRLFSPSRPLASKLILLLLTSLMMFSAPALRALDAMPVIDIHVQVLNSDNENDGTPRVDNRSTEFVHLLMQEAELEYRFHVTSMSRNLHLLVSRPNVLVYPIARIPEREKEAHWIGMVRPIHLSLVGLTSRLHELPTTLEGAKDFRIGVFRDGMSVNYLRSLGHTNFVYYADITNSMLMLERNRYDFFSFERYGLANFLTLNGYPEDFAEPVIPIEGISSELFYALSEPSDPEIAIRLRSAFAALVADGTFERIVGNAYDSEFDDF